MAPVLRLDVEAVLDVCVDTVLLETVELLEEVVVVPDRTMNPRE